MKWGTLFGDFFQTSQSLIRAATPVSGGMHNQEEQFVIVNIENSVAKFFWRREYAQIIIQDQLL